MSTDNNATAAADDEDDAFLQFIESKVIDAGDVVSAKSLSADLNFSLRKSQSVLTKFVSLSKRDLTYYFVEVSAERVCLRHKRFSEYNSEQVVEAVATKHLPENLVLRDLEYLLENRLQH